MVQKREYRSKTTTFSMRPSIYTKLQMISCVTSKPVNSIVNELLEQYVAEHTSDVEEYKRMYPEEE